MVEVGARLRRTRERKGMTQAELSRRTGIPPSLIANIEAGRRRMSLMHARAIARALGVSIDYLAGTFEDENSETRAAATS